MPARTHADAVPLLVLGELLHNGRAARLYAALVEGGRSRRTSREASTVSGGAWYDGTTLLLSRIAYSGTLPYAKVLDAFDAEVRADRGKKGLRRRSSRA